jgi:hypothetical protein
MITVGATVTVDKVSKIWEELKVLADKRVLVGVTEDTSDRPDGKLTNAFLAYIHDNGAPSRGIPARPFMKPGIAKAQGRINREMRLAAKSFIDGNASEGTLALHRAGMVAQNSIRMVISKGEGFSPLKRGTLLGRMRRRKYLYKKLYKSQRELYMSSFKPLIDTGELLKSISYQVEEGS